MGVDMIMVTKIEHDDYHHMIIDDYEKTICKELFNLRQTSYLSKDLRDRNFGPQKFTQKKRNLR